MSVSDWSTSAGSNTSVAGINIAPGMARSDVDNAIRAIMAEVKAKLNEAVSVKDYGAVGNGVNDDTTAIQAAMDANDYVYFPAGTYNITKIRFKRNNQVLYGAGFGTTTLASTLSAGGDSVIANNTPGTTLIGCELRDMKVTAGSLATGYVIDWRHIQLGRIERVWAYGGGANCTGFNFGATWAVTECTYNTIIGCYTGNVLKGFAFGDGANSNTIINCRAQPAFAGGYGFFLFGSAAGRISNNVFTGGGTEYPGNVSGGFYIGQGSDGTTVTGHRFESLSVGITTVAGTTNTTIVGNYFSSNSTDILDSGTGTVRAQVAGIVSPSILSKTSAMGYTTGAGGTVTQATSKSTGVTLNKACGTVTMNNASLAASTAVSFTLTNSEIAASDTVLVSVKSGATAGAYSLSADAVAAGSCQISLRNLTAGALAEAVVFNFAIIKAVQA